MCTCGRGTTDCLNFSSFVERSQKAHRKNCRFLSFICAHLNRFEADTASLAAAMQHRSNSADKAYHFHCATPGREYGLEPNVSSRFFCAIADGYHKILNYILYIPRFSDIIPNFRPKARQPQRVQYSLADHIPGMTSSNTHSTMPERGKPALPKLP